jgi:cytochrome c2
MLATKVVLTTGSGAKDFDQNCGDCHPNTAGTNDVGPTLFAVVDRKAGRVPGLLLLALLCGGWIKRSVLVRE